MGENQMKVYTMEEVKKHDKNSSTYWIVLDGKVYDVTKFLSEHPGCIKKLVDVLFFEKKNKSSLKYIFLISFSQQSSLLVKSSSCTGGDDILLEHAGTDATEDFENVKHSDDARELRKKYCIGILKK
jgi:cytochrome b involved in lipid metabolism